MKKFKIYLAGKMSGLTFESMNNWRVEADKLLKDESYTSIHTINPVSFYNFEMSPDSYTDKEVMKFDLKMVADSDVILVNLSDPNSIGTAIELYSAHDILNKPVIGFGLNNNNPCHPWMKLCLTKECKSLPDAIDYIIDYYLPNF